jgi:uroporphyrinogen III methyltransferase/synthase
VTTTTQGHGSVVFIGAGPGDPGLLTLRAVEALQEADVVVLERADQRALLAAVPGLGDPEVLEVGVDDAGLPLSVAARAKAVVAAAKAGRRVARVLLGDPFADSSGAAEAAACAKAGVRHEVVPGVPVSAGVAGYAGVVLGRHRAVVDLRIGSETSAVPVPARRPGTTCVLLGGPDAILATLPALADAGWADDTAAIVVQDGTTVAQQTRRGRLADLARLLDDASPGGTLVVTLGAEAPAALDWFEAKPLFGWRVLVPRTKEQAGALSVALQRAGAVAEEVPTIAVEPPRNPKQMTKALRGLVEGSYEWIALTSGNALRAVREGLAEHGLDARALSGIKVAVVGERTAEALREWGIEPDLVPSGEQSSRGLLEDWPPFDDAFDPINRVLLPRADIATETLAEGLVALGWEVDDVTAYRTVRAAPPAAPIRDAIKAGGFDAVAFTSSSTIRNLVGIAGKPHPTTVVACIGPQTARTAEEFGLRVDVLAATPSVGALAEALADFGARRRAEQLAAGEPVTRPSDRRRPGARRPKPERHAT